jgi:tRNA threonylcarbamoyladenosine biosynthesis protein TsaB
MRLLLLDTCGETGSLALSENGVVLRERSLPARGASAHLVRAIREELEEIGWPLRILDAIGVVNGPGSFTGVRVGLAAAKGLCEIAGLRLVTVSRLAVLLSLGMPEQDAAAILDAGRGEFYVRTAEGREELLDLAALRARVEGKQVLVAEEKLLEALSLFAPHMLELSASCALPLVEDGLKQGVEDSTETSDANYVRSARALYPAAGSVQHQVEP